MSEDKSKQSSQEEAPSQQLEGGTYEIIKGRLDGHAKELTKRLDQLNHKRKEVFGSIETKLLKTERITTENNCIPRDMVSINDFFLFGYNVHIGLRSEILPADALCAYKYEDHLFHKYEHDFLKDQAFNKDFKDLYKYYKNANFVKFSIKGPFLYLIFRVGKNVTDIKAFKFEIKKNQLTYVGNRSEQEHDFPPQHEFEWKRTHRDLHVSGEHPHISIEDRLFVETIGGDLTIKIDDNTDSGEGIYSEDVENPDQTLDDADFFYTIIENIILLKIRPYQEEDYRYFAYSEKAKKVARIDTIKDACVLLPENHGIIFPNGYFLQTGEYKEFENNLNNLTFEKRTPSPNGEDYLYNFYNRLSGDYVLLSYNLIEQKVETPILCNGYSLFENGEMLYFKTEDSPQKHHSIQIWQTPFTGLNFNIASSEESYLYKVGNKDLVGGMAEAQNILNLLKKGEAYEGVYTDIVKKTGDLIDSYFWLDNEEAYNFKEPLLSIKEAAAGAVDEFEKVVKLRQNASATEKNIKDKAIDLERAIYSAPKDHIDTFVQNLAKLRGIRGEIISSKTIRYINLENINAIEDSIAQQTEKLSQQCVLFLLKPESLNEYIKNIEDINTNIPNLKKGTEAKELEEAIEKSSNELEMLIDIVSNLKIEDPTQTTQIIDNISSLFSTVNQTKVKIKNKKKELLSVEGVAEFNSQIKLMGHSITNYLDVSDTPEKCDEYMTKIMVQLEELEGKFSEFDEFIDTLTDKREEIINAFESKKVTLLEARNKRATSLHNAADRILKGIKNRAEQFTEINEINGYFASDLMIEKVRDIIIQLMNLGDTVKSDETQSRLKTLQEEAVRQLKDKKELFVDGKNIIKLGKHSFTVNTQELDLGIVLKNEEMFFHLGGTNFFEEITDENFLNTRSVWEQKVPSENENVYRSEYLAFQFLKHLERDQPTKIFELLQKDDAEFLKEIQEFMNNRYQEAYTKGLHDQDTSSILRPLLEIHAKVGLLKFNSNSRSLASYFWSHFINEDIKEVFKAKLKGFGVMNKLFTSNRKQKKYILELNNLISKNTVLISEFPLATIAEASEYLFEQLQSEQEFVVAKEASTLLEDFRQHLKTKIHQEKFQESIDKLKEYPISRLQLIKDWIESYIDFSEKNYDKRYINETAILLSKPDTLVLNIIEATITQDIQKLGGSHNVISDGNYHLNYNDFLFKLNNFENKEVKEFYEYSELKKELIEKEKNNLRLSEFKPKVLTSFVRNRLIDEIYLPIIGDNFAKQMGAAGDSKRTDLMGMLLLISPPGYGKTTLMEYVSNRLGLTFMKINGPAIGHSVTSLDPEEAPNASAKEEVNKLNLALEMGDNIMIYLDDIQHTNPEFLQKFISLCDGQRRIEGVYKGKSKTYDLRGRKVAVVMAGNPYTESGDKFQIPDMLANRADTYNLGDIIGDKDTAFKMSYIENSLTSNAILNKLASSSQKDVYAIIEIAETGTREGIDFQGNYSIEEINEYVNTMKKIIRVRDVILSVNLQYIKSAATQDEYRTEPSFKLQGSYRNMNKIVEKILPIMNDHELETLIDSHYQNEAQTLTTGAEANLLKFNELKGTLSEEEALRWQDIKRTFKKKQSLHGVESGDKVGQVILQISNLSEGLDSIKDALSNGITKLSNKPIESNSSEQIIQTIQDSIIGLKEGLVQGLNTQARAQAPQIEITNRIPKIFVNVLKHQFTIMETWLKSLQESSSDQSTGIQELGLTLKDATSDFQKIMKAIEDNGLPND